MLLTATLAPTASASARDMQTSQGQPPLPSDLTALEQHPIAARFWRSTLQQPLDAR